MCGIAGSWAPTRSPDESLALVKSMTSAISSRGPDADGHWSDERAGLVLGHRRLSILDLSERASQPMVSASGRFVLSYNGEIYNFRELRSKLERAGVRFLGDSDTEVVLAAIASWGIEAAVCTFVGMFAFALWDREERVLSLVRDRLGIKPLYYAEAGSDLLFCSQPKGFLRHKSFSKELSGEALAGYLRSSCVPSALCMFKDARKVEPGTIMRFAEANVHRVTRYTYWDAAAMAEAGQENLLPNSANLAPLIDKLDELLTDAVRCRLVSDVPLGAFLSGGIDSSLVVALMKKLGGEHIKTFTIGTKESSHDESADARSIAEHLGTDHHELIATPQAAVDVVGDLARYYDEPFADSSQIPTLLVSRLAREHVTVSLSGDGGDELFGGYNRHRWGPRIANVNQVVPRSLRHALARTAGALRPATWDRLFEVLVPDRFSVRLPSDKLAKIARCLLCDTEDKIYEELAASNASPEEFLVSGSGYSRSVKTPQFHDRAHRFMYQDMVGYLQNDILTKVDRASMAVSLEARVPLLDHRVVEFAWRLPLRAKIFQGQGKWILRQVLYRYVPRALLDRPKSGFGIPIGAWLRGPLRDWAEDLLEEGRLREQGIFRPAPIRRRLREHLSGTRDWDQHLWDMLMFQSWWNEYLG